MSPTTFTLPFRKPKMLSGFSTAMGTSFAMGLPRLVMMSSLPLAWTSSMMERHFALKAPAPMVFIGPLIGVFIVVSLL